MKMESIPPVHAIMVINVLRSPNMFWEDTYGKCLSAIAICLQLCAHKITSASAGTSAVYYAENQHLLTVAYHLYRVLTETYSSVHSNPKTSIVSQTLQVKATQSHTLLGMCRTETPRDSEPQLHMASELDIGCWWSWVHWAEGRKTLPESLLA